MTSQPWSISAGFVGLVDVCLVLCRNLMRTAKSIPGSTFYQSRLIGLQIKLHSCMDRRLSSPHLSELSHHPVVNEALANICNPNVTLFRLPELTFGQSW
jgi:hypothetical protein